VSYQRRRGFTATLVAALLPAALVLALSCGDEPSAPGRGCLPDPGGPGDGADPFGLQAEVLALGVTLTWAVPQEAESASLQILRSDDCPQCRCVMAHLPPGSASWIDSAVGNGRTYMYRIIALDPEGGVALESGVCEVRISEEPVWMLNDGDAYATDRSVPVRLLATTAVSMRVTVSASSAWVDEAPAAVDPTAGPRSTAAADPASAPWVPAAAFSHITLPEAQGEYFVSAQVRYGDGSVSQEWKGRVILDTAPPVIALTETHLDAGTRTVSMSAAGTHDDSDVCPVDSLTYEWCWGDGATDGPSPLYIRSHKYAGRGPWVITLTARDLAGWESHESRVVMFPGLPPAAPSGPRPADGSVDTPLNTTLAWAPCADPDGGAVMYDVYLGLTNPPPLVSPAQVGTAYDPGGLRFEKAYYWRIAAINEGGLTAEGPLWSFTTRDRPGAMVRIPAGETRLGQSGMANAPLHTVHVEGFRIEVYEVSNELYKDFIDAGGYDNEALWDPAGWEWRQRNSITLPLYWNEYDYHGGGTRGTGQFPVNGVSWWEADAYCRWAGKRLPTEAEWEKAARGCCAMWVSPGRCDDVEPPAYPWGEGITGSQANYSQSGDPWERGGRTTPVGFYDGTNHNGFQTMDSPSPYGLYDMAGNVWEWTSSSNAGYPYDPDDGREDPPAAANECCRVLRGGAWYDIAPVLRSAHRSSNLPGTRSFAFGFRCACD